MRSLVDIYDDIKDHEESIKTLKVEIELFQELCPHPNEFLIKKYIDFNDNAQGVAQYESTVLTVNCVLCGKKASTEYDKNSIKDNPVAEEIIKGK